MSSESRTRILSGALDLLREGQSISLESAAQRAGLTKPGLMYHFRTKEALMVALVDHVIDRWERALMAAAGASVSELTAGARIRAYADFSLSTDFDESDVVMLADPRLRATLSARWEERVAPWVAIPSDTSSTTRGRLVAVRLLADGVWFASATDVLDPDASDRELVRAVVDDLLGGSE
ncbi:TetR/AcrR family transcriptional regulator [Gordonia sp. PKS22-38]|uniref:TetR/AcrR family transcriptional regulator n=1 Tax=Gordonia prachuapensis TaxID=3115651 RepID=A0ABU7MPF0_9ACTN|nr:TetR/AcrR family transcriptional regulator [Gordonia sp. PKS22-38]